MSSRSVSRCYRRTREADAVLFEVHSGRTAWIYPAICHWTRHFQAFKKLRKALATSIWYFRNRNRPIKINIEGDIWREAWDEGLKLDNSTSVIWFPSIRVTSHRVKIDRLLRVRIRLNRFVPRSLLTFMSLDLPLKPLRDKPSPSSPTFVVNFEASSFLPSMSRLMNLMASRRRVKSLHQLPLSMRSPNRTPYQELAVTSLRWSCVLSILVTLSRLVAILSPIHSFREAAYPVLSAWKRIK